MRLLSYRHAGSDRYGAVQGDGVVDLNARVGDRWPTLKSALESEALDDLAQAIAGTSADHALAEIAFDLPIPRPDKIFCAGRNYRAYHEVVESGDAPAYPSIFSRLASSFAPHGEAILKPRIADSLDYEGELVAVIGRRGRYIDAAEALTHVAGYTCMNEGTVREWASRGTQNTPAKNFYRSGSIGPWLVTADEIADPGRLHITTRRNGEVVQDGGTDMMIFDLAYLIAHISQFTWLEPGDMIATGSPGGSIVESETPAWLKPGDKLEIEVSGIGTLANTIEAD